MRERPSAVRTQTKSAILLVPQASLPNRDTAWLYRGVGLQISTRKSAVTIVDLEGKATIGTDDDLLQRSLRKLTAGGERNLLLNLADLTQVDSEVSAQSRRRS